MPLEVGVIVEGKVKSIAPFGAFVELSQGSTGLVHISEISLDYVENINEHLKIGDVVRVKIVSLDNGKINLSIKKVLEEERKRTCRPIDIDWTRQQNQKLSFEDMLSKFKQESDEKIQFLKSVKEPRRTRGI